MKEKQNTQRIDDTNTAKHTRRTLLRQATFSTTAFTLGIVGFGNVAAKGRDNNSSTQKGSSASNQGLPNPNPDENNAFGEKIELSVDGKTALIASNDQVYVFEHTASKWALTGRLSDPQSNEDNRFGDGIALSGNGNVALVGAPYKNTNIGMAYVFTRTASGWTLTGEILNPEPDEGDSFGDGVALNANGRIAIIGASGDVSSALGGIGEAYVFTLIADDWTHIGTLPNPEPFDLGALGRTVTLSTNGRVALLGAASSNASIGSYVGEAYVFEQTSSGWIEASRLVNPEPDRYDYFGDAIALSGNGRTALIGAPYDEAANSLNAGEAYIFTSSNDGWEHTTTLSNPNPTRYDLFGKPVALDDNGDTALISSSNTTAEGRGEISIFSRTNSEWRYTGKLSNPEPDEDEVFGNSVALSGNGRTALVGVSSTNPPTGEVYAFTMRGKTR